MSHPGHGAEVIGLQDDVREEHPADDALDGVPVEEIKKPAKRRATLP